MISCSNQEDRLDHMKLRFIYGKRKFRKEDVLHCGTPQKKGSQVP